MSSDSFTKEANAIIISEFFKKTKRKQKEQLKTMMNNLYRLVREAHKPKTTFWSRLTIMHIGFFFGSIYTAFRNELDMGISLGVTFYVIVLFSVIAVYEIGRITLGKKKRFFDD